MTAVETIEEVRQRRYEVHRSAEYEALRQDETTWAGETLDAPLHKPLEYAYQNGELYSSQAQPMSKIFEGSVSYYDDLRRQESRAEFQYRRSLVEQEEFKDMVRMAEGKLPNTMVVFSTYPDEMEGETEDYLGYQTRRKLGFIRVISRNDNGNISMRTHSFDGHFKPGIESMFQYVGGTVDWKTDPLQQRVYMDIEKHDECGLLLDQILYQYDKALHETYGGQWFAGRSGQAEREAIRFVEQQNDLVYVHVKEILGIKERDMPMDARQLALDTQRYNFAIALRRRFENSVSEFGDVSREMSTAGAIGRSEGETVSGCGMTVTSDTPSESLELSQAGYGTPRLHEGEFIIDKCMQCPHCRLRSGVKVQKQDGAIHYTCLNSNCGATTLLATEAPKRQRHKAARANGGSPVSMMSSIDSRRSQKNSIMRLYGPHASVQRRIVVGSAEYVVIGQNGEELKSSSSPKGLIE